MNSQTLSYSDTMQFDGKGASENRLKNTYQYLNIFPLHTSGIDASVSERKINISLKATARAASCENEEKQNHSSQLAAFVGYSLTCRHLD